MMLPRVFLTIMILVVGITTPQTAAGQGMEGIDPTVCAASSADDGSAISTPVADLTSGLPAGMALRLLAEGTVNQLPRQNLVLVVRAVTVQPGAASEVDRTRGALLYVVTAGVADIAINGTPETYVAGSSVLVAPDQFYGLINPGDEPVALLRLSIEPSGQETEVSVGDPLSVTHEDGEVDAVSPERIVSRVVMRAEVGRLPEGTVRLFLGCMAWEDPGADSGELRQPSSVGLVVLKGQLRLGESDVINAGRCLQFRPQAAHRLQSGTPPPMLLIFGAIPSGQHLWMSSDPVSGQAAIPVPRCGDQH